MITQRKGFTLVETVCWLALLGILIALFASPFTAARDVLAVRAARDHIAAAAARARSHAPGHGGADVRIDARAGTITITTRDGAVEELSDISAARRVRIEFANTQAAVATLRYDALGIGRIASRTINLSSGRVAGGVTFSSLGRARVW